MVQSPRRLAQLSTSRLTAFLVFSSLVLQGKHARHAPQGVLMSWGSRRSGGYKSSRTSLETV
eukprot:768583-Hanusia_phi.AAC.1